MSSSEGLGDWLAEQQAAHTPLRWEFASGESLGGVRVSVSRERPTYYALLAERYPWADDQEVARAAAFLQVNLRELIDSQLQSGEREIDWDRLTKIGSELCSIIGPVPQIRENVG
jgi:hypothetical protein